MSDPRASNQTQQGAIFDVRHREHITNRRQIMSIGTIGGIVGVGGGFAGGFIGAYCSYKRAKSSRERRFVIWASIAMLVYVGLFLVVFSFLPWARNWTWAFYFIVQMFGIRSLIRWQSKIQREEQTR
jgi:hypothetical protein